MLSKPPQHLAFRPQHSHSGPSIISVKSGDTTEYHADDPNTPIVHFAGTSFVDDGEGAHIIVKEGITDLELVAFQILPLGATRRIDEPAPWGTLRPSC